LLLGYEPITGTEAELLARLPQHHYAPELAAIQAPARRVQYLAARVLAHNLATWPADQYVVRAPNGHPAWQNGEGFLSLAHTEGHVAAAWHPDRRIGIDVEDTTRLRSNAMARMFLNERDQLLFQERQEDARFFYLHWTAKEALYKAVSNVDKGLSFKRHIWIDTPTGPIPEQGETRGTVIDGEVHIPFRVVYTFFGTVLVTCAVED
jgi:4'-phosphopantetheinyl transferase EntD